MAARGGRIGGYRVQQDDRTLVQLAQGGDALAFGELYERYFDRIYGYVAFRVVDQTAAEDVAEQVFVRALEGLASFQWRGVPFVAWLFRIARNQVVDHCRERVRRPTVPLEEAVLVAGREPSPESAYEDRLTQEELRQAISRLTDAQQLVIALKFTSGLSNAEVAGVLNKTEGAVKALQHSALASLRQKLAGKAAIV